MGVRPKVRAGEIPERRPGKIADPVWILFERCWRKAPARRPPLVKLYDVLSNYRSRPGVTDTPQEREIEELPRELCLEFQSITPSPTAELSKGCSLYLKAKYGEMNYTTPPTNNVQKYEPAKKMWYAYAHFCPLPHR